MPGGGGMPPGVALCACAAPATASIPQTTRRRSSAITLRSLRTMESPTTPSIRPDICWSPDGRDPFRVLVAELDGSAQTHRISKRIGEQVAAVLEGQQSLRMQRRRQVDTARVVVCRLEGDVFGPEICADAFEKEAQRDSGPTADIAPAL